MSIWVILIEMAAFAAIFTAIVFLASSGDRKHSPAAIHNYPPDIQAEYFKTHARIDVSYRSKNVILTKGFGVLLFTGILLVCALVAGAKTFWQGFWLAFGLMVWIGVYDTCFLDWVHLRADPRRSGGVACILAAMTQSARGRDDRCLPSN